MKHERMLTEEIRECRAELRTMLAVQQPALGAGVFLEMLTQEGLTPDAFLSALKASVGSDLHFLFQMPQEGAQMMESGLAVLQFMEKVQQSYKTLDFNNIRSTVAHQSAVLTASLELRAQVVTLAATMENFLATHAALVGTVATTHTVISGGGGVYSLDAIKADPLTIQHDTAQAMPVARLLIKVVRAAADLQNPIKSITGMNEFATRQVLLSQTQLISQNFARAFMLAIQLKDLRGVFPSASER